MEAVDKSEQEYPPTLACPIRNFHFVDGDGKVTLTALNCTRMHIPHFIIDMMMDIHNINCLYIKS